MKIFRYLDSILCIDLSFNNNNLKKGSIWLERNSLILIIPALSAISIYSFIFYYQNGLGLAYNDARSHLDIGRRVVEGLNTGIAQLGSVWLPLTHILMIPTVWNDFMWHSGLAGALPSMLAFVGTGILIYYFLKELNIGLSGRLVGIFVFAANLNILYLQSTAMTELVLLGTMTAGSYYFLLWHKNRNIVYLLESAFWIMLSTLVRYDGWFLFFLAAVMIFIGMLRAKGYKVAEGMTVMFCTLAGFGIFLWFLWNLLIFKDALYFIFGPYSAYSQQTQLEAAGVLATKRNWLYSATIYTYALAYNSGAFNLILGFVGAIYLWIDKKNTSVVRAATLILIAPILFNILALYLGHSVLYIQGISGNTWFNVRYGIMMMPSLAIFIGYLVGRAEKMRYVLVGLLVFVTFFSFANSDAVTIDAAGGGGNGNPLEREPEMVESDMIEGYVSIEAAKKDYGVVIDPKTFKVDMNETKKLRGQ